MTTVSPAAFEMIREAIANVERGVQREAHVACAIATIKITMIGFFRRRIVVEFTPTTKLGWARIESADFGDTKIANLAVVVLEELGRRH